MKIILISFPGFFEGEDEIIVELMYRYNFTFHLRKPDATVEEYDQFLRKLPESIHKRIMIHDAYELMEKYKLMGVHINKKKRAKFSDYSKFGGVVSTSCHSLDEVKWINGQFDYALLSPIFPSLSKEGYLSEWNMNELTEYLKSKRRTEIIALGGINDTKVEIVKKTHFDGFAVLGSVWTGHPDKPRVVLKNFKKIYQCVHNEHTV